MMVLVATGRLTGMCVAGAVLLTLGGVSCGQKSFRSTSTVNPSTGGGAPTGKAQGGQPDGSAKDGSSPGTADTKGTAGTSGTNGTTSSSGSGSGTTVVSCTNGAIKQDVLTIRLSGNDGARCPFGLFGNDPKRNARLSARIERRFDINVPAGRRVCSLSAQSAQQLVSYDDQLFLTVNDNLIVSSSQHAASLAIGSNGFQQYSWEGLRGKSTANQIFCAAGVTCQLPPSERTGTFSFQMTSEANARLFNSLAGQSLFFGLIVTGDDDDGSDCQFDRDVDLTVTYTYVD